MAGSVNHLFIQARIVHVDAIYWSTTSPESVTEAPYLETQVVNYLRSTKCVDLSR
jgi:hypothetical protein